MGGVCHVGTLYGGVCHVGTLYGWGLSCRDTLWVGFVM